MIAKINLPGVTSPGGEANVIPTFGVCNRYKSKIACLIDQRFFIWNFFKRNCLRDSRMISPRNAKHIVRKKMPH